MLLPLLLLAACGEPTGPVVRSVEVDRLETTLRAGDTLRVHATVRGRGGGAGDPWTVVWTSADTSIATVDSTGLITAHFEGATWVTAAVGDRSDSTRVTVVPTVPSLRIAPAELQTIVGGRLLLFASAPGEAPRTRVWKPGELQWSSSDTTVARIDSTGVVEGVSEGVAVIRVRGGGTRAESTVTVGPAVTYSEISPGTLHTCGTASDGRVLCWGASQFGEMGSRTAPEYCNQYGCKWTPSLAPLPVGSGRYLSVTAGHGYNESAHSCALDPTGGALCWGSVPFGEVRCSNVSLATYPCTFVPVRVPGDAVFRSIDAGHAFTCGLAPDGTVHCWGDSSFGQAGGEERWTQRPSRLEEAARFDSLSVGARHACALTPDGRAFCWGGNYLGQLGTGAADTARHAVPQPVSGDLRFVQVRAGGENSCALTPEGKAHCWGAGRWGVVPDATDRCARVYAAALCATTPRPVAEQLAFSSITVGQSHACGVTLSGEGWCWGSTSKGRLGSGAVTGEFTSAPLLVGSELRWRTLSAGYMTTCGITVDGGAYCWGDNQFGQLGIGSVGGERSVPTRVAGQPQR